jgi:branched-chain amino acid transport system permease protein
MHRYHKSLVAFSIAGFFLVLLRDILNPFYMDIVFTVCLFAGLGMAWNIIGGFAGQFSLGHAAFFGIGAYISTLLYINYGISPWAGMVLGGIAAAAISLAVFYPCFKLRGIFFAMSTMAFAQVVNIIAIFSVNVTKGSIGLLIPFKPSFSALLFADKGTYAIIAFSYMLVSYLVCMRLRYSKTGYYLIALRENEEAAQALGIHTTNYKLVAMMLSAFVTAVGGTIYAQYLQFIDPDSLFPATMSIRFAILAIIGGIGSVTGPMIGSIILTPIDVFLRGWLGGSYAGLGFFIYGCILIVVVLLWPKGMIPIFKNMWKKQAGEPSKTETTSAADDAIPPADHPFETGHVPFGNDDILKINTLSKKFGGLSAIKEVVFTVKRGQIFGLIGPNGAGKTTLFNLLTGFVNPDAGEIYFNHTNITKIRPPSKICSMGLTRTFQIVKPFPNITVLENVIVGAFHKTPSMVEAQRIAEATLKFVGLQGYSHYLASSLTLSNRKRLELARCIATNPRMILLDETMAGLNPREIDEMILLLRRVSEKGITLVIIEHVMRAIMAISDTIIVLHHGELIAEGKPSEICRNTKVVEAYLGGVCIDVNS